MINGATKNENSLYDLFLNASFKYPENTAVAFNHDEHSGDLKYVFLLAEIQKLSKYLDRYAKKTTYIGIRIKSFHLAPAIILGILRLGKPFVVVREQEMAGWLLERLGCACVVAERGCWKSCDGLLLSRLELHGVTLDVWAVEGVAPRPETSACLAYAVHTSGSSGPPKVVQVPHSALLPNISDLRRLLHLTERDVVLLAAPLTFDPSMVELFLALSSGATLRVVTSGPSASHLQGVTVLQVTPSVLGHWLGVRGVLPTGLRVLLLGGEPCPPPPVLARWTGGRDRCQVFNVYGVTEVSCWASLQEVDWDEHSAGVPLGAPLSGTLLSVRDQAGRAVTQGEGELFVGSLERTCFVGDEEVKTPVEPVFRATGDIVQVDATRGSLLYVRRGDRTIKLWGHRVDVTAVERESSRWRPEVECRCVWEEGTGTLGLFMLGEDVEAREARWHLVRNLPPPAVPDVIKVLPRWPLTAHGKVNETALRALLQEDNPQSDDKRHGRDVGEALTALWHKYLGPNKPSPTDNFVQSGGNSFLSLKLAAELEKLTGQPVPPRLVPMLLEGRMLSECCRYLVSQEQYSRGEEVVSATRTEGRLVRHLAQDGRELGGGSSTEELSVSNCRGRVTTYDGREPGSSGVLGDQVVLSVLWKVDLGKCVDASPLAALYSSGRELVYVGSHSRRLAALDGDTGHILWQTELPDRIESSMCVSTCGTLGVVGCYDGGVYCVRLDSGARCWEFFTDQMVKCSPTLCKSGSAVVVGSYDRHLYCLRLQDGAELWRVELGGAVLSSPLLHPESGLVFAAALDGSCVALAEQDGCRHWGRRLASPVFASPALLSAGRVLFTEVSGTLRCLLAATGHQVWSLALGAQAFSSPCVLEDGAVLQGCQDGSVRCVEGTGQVRWSTTLDSAVVSTPCYLRGTQLAAVASSGGRVFVLALASGSRQSCQLLPHQVFSSPASCRPHRVYLGCRDDHLYCLAVR